MDSQQILKNEDMTDEEFIILCANLTGNEKKIIINPIHPLDAKCALTKLKKRPDFFEFAINNFYKMHHPVSTGFLINHIYYTLQVTTISFDLYDSLIDQFFQNLSPWLKDKDYPIVYKVQVKLFLLLYDYYFWKQLFVCEECSTYMLKNPENQVFSFLNCLGINLRNDRKQSLHIIEKMMNDKVFDIFFQYLFDKYNAGFNGAIDIINLFISILDYSYVVGLPMISDFLKQLQTESDPTDAIKYLVAIFATNSHEDEIDPSQKMHIIESFNEINLFEYFKIYLDNQLEKLKAGVPVTTIQQFSRLISEMMNCIIFYSPSNEEEMDIMKQFFTHYAEIFFKTLICLSELPNEYSLFILKVMEIIPEQVDDILHILLEKFVFFTGKYQIIPEATIVTSNYLELYLRLVHKFNFDQNTYFSPIFEKFGPDDNGRIAFLFSILEILISKEGYMEQKDHLHSIPAYLMNFISQTIDFYNLIIKEDFQASNEKEYANMIKSYGYLIFSNIDNIPEDRKPSLISSLFIISKNNFILLGDILSEIIENYFDFINQFDDLNELSISFMSSIRSVPMAAGILLANKLHHLQELIIQAFDIIMHNIKNEEGILFTFSVLKPLFMNLKNLSSNQDSSEIVDKELQLREFMLFLLESINQKKSEPKQTDTVDSDDEIDYSEWSALHGLEDDFPNWLEAYLHVFGFSEFEIVKPMILEHLNTSKDSECVENDIELNIVGIMAKELALDMPTEINPDLEFVNEIVIFYTGHFLKYFESNHSETNEEKFCYKLMHGSIPYLDRAYITFGYRAIQFFITLMTTHFVEHIFNLAFPLLKIGVTYPIIDNKELLESFFTFVVQKIEVELEFFVEHSKRLIHFYLQQPITSELLVPIGRFHWRLLSHPNHSDLLRQLEFPEEYLKALAGIRLENESKRFVDAIKTFFS